MKVNAITLRKGNVVEHKDRLWVVLKSEINQPGKGAAVIRCTMRDLRSGNKMDETFRTQDTVERARLEQSQCQFLYQDGEDFHFMNQTSFEQLAIKEEVIGEPGRFLQDGMIVEVETFEGEPLSVTLPVSAIFEIAEADAVVKGQTASSSYKPAILDNGVKVMVPPFIEAGTRIVVRTEDGTYVERAKD